MRATSSSTSKPQSAARKKTVAQNGASLPSVSIRKVFGIVRRIGAKCAPDSLINSGRMTVPVYTSSGRFDFGAHRSLCAYAVVVTTVGCAVVATLGLGSALKHAPTLFFCSVILSSWFGGVWLGFVAVLLSAIALDYYFIPPIYALGISAEEAPDMIAFVASAFFVSWLSGKQSRGFARAKRDAKIREKTTAHESHGQAPEHAEGLNGARQPASHSSTLCPGEESAFLKQGDYWTIQYRGQIAHLRATRGLQCLAFLLGHPGREFHVSELAADVPAVAHPANSAIKEDAGQMQAGCVMDAGPILDARAKAEYARRVADLREELEDAERLNDSARVGRARQEIDCIADQLAAAVGLSGRDRKAASQAERARSAVTKRIKNSIDRIAKAMPALGSHLAVTIKTGYFCSYGPNPDHPVGWKVRP